MLGARARATAQRERLGKSGSKQRSMKERKRDGCERENKNLFSFLFNLLSGFYSLSPFTPASAPPLPLLYPPSLSFCSVDS